MRFVTNTLPASLAPRIDRWLAAGSLASAALLTTVACLRRIWTIDFWWQLSAGRHVAELGWPQVDVLTYTAAGQPWIEMRWLYCLLQYELMEVVGPAGPVLFKWLIFSAALALFALPLARRAGPVATAGVVAVAVLASSQRLLVRPELVTWLFAGAFVLLLDRNRRKQDGRIWLLPALQVVWANSHPGFLLGPLLIGLAGLVGLGRPTRRSLGRLGGLFLLSVAACAVNPYGIAGMQVPLDQFGQIRESVFKEVIAEVRSPLAFGLAPVAVRYYLLLLGLSLASATVNLKRLDPFWSLLWLSQLYLSTLAIRNIPLFALATVPFVLSNLSGSALLARLPRGAGRGARTAAGLLVIAGSLYYSQQIATDRFSVRQGGTKQWGLGVTEHRFPEREADFLEEAGGRVYATLLESSYLTSRRIRVYADPRGDVHGDARFRRYLAAQRDPDRWREEARAYDIRLALASLDSDFLDLLHADPDWDLVFFGTVAAVYARAGSEGGPTPITTVPQFDRTLTLARERLPPPVSWSEAGRLTRVSNPRPYLLLAELCIRNGRFEAAEELLVEAETASPFLTGLARRRAAIAAARGDYESLSRHAEAALEETPGDARLLRALAGALNGMGRRDEALRRVDEALRLEPDDPDLLALREEILGP